jgi:uncharacterized FlaG/YvyC family protein
MIINPWDGNPDYFRLRTSFPAHLITETGFLEDEDQEEMEEYRRQYREELKRIKREAREFIKKIKRELELEEERRLKAA